MKKTVGVLLCIQIVFGIFNLAFANDIKITSKMNNVITDSEMENEIRTVNYSINFNGKSIEKNITIHEFSPNVGDYVSLREIVEGLGGNIEWNPNTETKELGKFEFLNSKYVYKMHSSVKSLDEIPFKLNFPIDLYMIMDNKEIPLTMSSSVEAMVTRFVDDTIYINITALRKLLPRMGYLINLNENSRVISVKDYDFKREKELMLEKFPVGKFGKCYYGKEYNKYDYDKNLKVYYCYDLYFQQVSDTETIEKRYQNFIDKTYRSMFIKNDKNFYKDLLQMAYNVYTDDELNVKYDTDLDAYIIYNKEFSNVSELDDSYKIIVIRKFDNMLMFIK